MPGIEPGSKRGSNTLSTCLAPTWFSSNDWIRATDHYLSFLIFAKVPKQNLHYSRITCIAESGRFRKIAPGQCLVPAPGAGIKCNLHCRITQQERSYFRQLIVCPLRFLSQQTKLSMLTYLFYPLSKPVIPIFAVAFCE